MARFSANSPRTDSSPRTKRTTRNPTRTTTKNIRPHSAQALRKRRAAGPPSRGASIMFGCLALAAILMFATMLVPTWFHFPSKHPPKSKSIPDFLVIEIWSLLQSFFSIWDPSRDPSWGPCWHLFRSKRWAEINSTHASVPSVFFRCCWPSWQLLAPSWLEFGWSWLRFWKVSGAMLPSISELFAPGGLLGLRGAKRIVFGFSQDLDVHRKGPSQFDVRGRSCFDLDTGFDSLGSALVSEPIKIYQKNVSIQIRFIAQLIFAYLWWPNWSHGPGNILS